MTLKSGAGTEVNKARIGGETVLHGDPNIKIEKPHTIILFPGGSVEVARATDHNYWVHVAVHDGGLPDQEAGTIKACRLDCEGRYAPETNDLMATEIAKGDVNHIAFLIAKGSDS